MSPPLRAGFVLACLACHHLCAKYDVGGRRRDTVGECQNVGGVVALAEVAIEASRLDGIDHAQGDGRIRWQCG